MTRILSGILKIIWCRKEKNVISSRGVHMSHRIGDYVAAFNDSHLFPNTQRSTDAAG